jgi:hypothetical protein
VTSPKRNARDDDVFLWIGRRPAAGIGGTGLITAFLTFAARGRLNECGPRAVPESIAVFGAK